MARITEIVIWGFDFDFFESADWVINWYMERVGIEFPIGDAFDFAKFFAVNLGKATSDTFSWSGKKAEVEFVFLAEAVTLLAHMADDIEAEFASFFVFAVVPSAPCP